MKITMILAVLAFATSALADGFVCQDENDTISAKVFNHVDPSVGTRVGAIMVLSDPQVQPGRRTIAVFVGGETLSNEGAAYHGKVDHRYNNTGRQGELIGGTKIKYLKSVLLDVDFKYSRPVDKGVEIDADLVLNKRNGDQIIIPMVCSRYLKN